MEIISTCEGFVLVFESEKDLKQHIENLKGQKEWVEEEGIKPPYLYSVFSSEIDAEKVKERLDEIKEKW